MAEDLPENETILVHMEPEETTAVAKGSAHNALPLGSRMGEFEIIGLIGEGGFGIVYLAQDHSLDRKVALKEYMPAALAARAQDGSVKVRSERHSDTFGTGLRSFVNEARLLARFDHPALVKVYRFWESNGTAYMAMPYYDGRTLREIFAETSQAPDEATLLNLLAPILDALELIHAEHCFHRDIAPDNIMLLRDGRPVLLDFGAARRVISDMTQALTVILKPGYAPIEQYAEMPGMKQGPWTDIYALAAVVYYAISRKLPPPSVSRIVEDTYEPLSRIAADRYSASFLSGLDACLAVKAENRPQSISRMRELIGMHETPLIKPEPKPLSPPAAVPSAASMIRVDQDELRPHRETKRRTLPAKTLGITAALLAALVSGYSFLNQKPPKAQAIPVPEMSILLTPPPESQLAATPGQETAAPISSELNATRPSQEAPPLAAQSAPLLPSGGQAATTSVQAEASLSSESVPEASQSPNQTMAASANRSTPPAPSSSAPGAPPSKAHSASNQASRTKKSATSASQENNNTQAERDYMRQLNKELQSLSR